MIGRPLCGRASGPLLRRAVLSASETSQDVPAAAGASGVPTGPAGAGSDAGPDVRPEAEPEASREDAAGPARPVSSVEPASVEPAAVEPASPPVLAPEARIRPALRTMLQDDAWRRVRRGAVVTVPLVVLALWLPGQWQQVPELDRAPVLLADVGASLARLSCVEQLSPGGAVAGVADGPAGPAAAPSGSRDARWRRYVCVPRATRPSGGAYGEETTTDSLATDRGRRRATGGAGAPRPTSTVRVRHE